MLEAELVIGVAIIAGAAVLAATLLSISRASLRSEQAQHRLRAYEDLFSAINALHVAGDEYRLEQAKVSLARTLMRVNLVAPPDVIMRVNDLLDFFNESGSGEYEVLKSLNILNALVIAMRNDLEPAVAKDLQRSGIRFRFFAPRR